MRWDSEQEQILREFGHRGAEYCRNLIFKKFGILRSVEATQRQASRINAPLAQHQTCPVCGRIERKLNRNSGLCEACNYERLWREQVEEEIRIRRELQRGGDEGAALQAKRKYDAQRRKVTRLRKRAYGEYVDMSKKMSSPCSDRQKKFWEPPEKEICAPAW